MKRDLTEFTQVVQHDTACTIAATASVVKEKLAVSTTYILHVTVPHSLTYSETMVEAPDFSPTFLLCDCFSPWALISKELCLPSKQATSMY